MLRQPKLHLCGHWRRSYLPVSYAGRRRDGTNIPYVTYGQVSPFGSFQLGAYDIGKHADMDALFLAPQQVTRQDFSTSFVERLRNTKGVEDIHTVESCFVPIIKLIFDGIKFDLVFATLGLNTIPETFDPTDDEVLKGLDAKGHEMSPWASFVESQLHLLVGQLDKNKHVSLAHVSPKPLPITLQDDNKKALSTMWAIRVQFSLDAKRCVDYLTHDLQAFTNMVHSHAEKLGMQDIDQLLAHQMSRYNLHRLLHNVKGTEEV